MSTKNGKYISHRYKYPYNIIDHYITNEKYQLDIILKPTEVKKDATAPTKT